MPDPLRSLIVEFTTTSMSMAEFAKAFGPIPDKDRDLESKVWLIISEYSNGDVSLGYAKELLRDVLEHRW